MKIVRYKKESKNSNGFFHISDILTDWTFFLESMLPSK